MNDDELARLAEAAEFGGPPIEDAPTPDHTATEADAKPRTWRRFFGMNEPVDSPNGSALPGHETKATPKGKVRPLTKKDKEKIAGTYGMLALASMPFNQRASIALMEQSEACAEEWVKLAEVNTSVRRVLLMFLEGGMWGGVVLAHVPIMAGILPEGNMFEKIVSKMNEDSTEDQGIHPMTVAPAGHMRFVK